MFAKNEMPNCTATMDHVFSIADSKMESEHDKKVLVGLRQMVKELEMALYRPQPRFQDAFFFPSFPNLKKVQKYIQIAKKSIDLCIFSYTNDDLSGEIMKAHERGVNVRIITDDEAMKGKGADAKAMADKGVSVRCDSEERFHMHNKFMIVDRMLVLTGSFNWSFQAVKSNQENVIVVDGDYFIGKYVEEFEKLWGQFSGNELEMKQHHAATRIQKQWKGKKSRDAAKIHRAPKDPNNPWGL